MNNLLRKSTLFPYTTLFRSYEVRMRDTKKEELRRTLFKEKHPLEKLKRIGLGPLTVEGIPRGRYRMIEQKEAEDRKSTRLNSSHQIISYAVFCLKKKRR